MANTIVVPDIGKLTLGRMLNGLLSPSIIPANCQAQLYKAVSGTLGPATVFGDLTQPSFTGYSGVTLGSPTSAAVDGRDQLPFTYPAVAYQPTGAGGLPETVLGYFVIYTTGSLLLWVQPFTSSFVFSSTSTICTFQPVLETGQLDIP